MPIVYVHGVSTRDEKGWELLEALLRRYVAPKISKDPDNVQVFFSYWGDFGAKFRWNGASAPTSPLRNLRARVKEALHNPQTSITEEVHRLRNFTNEKLSDFAQELLAYNLQLGDNAELGEAEGNVLFAVAAEVAESNDTRLRLAQCISVHEEIHVLEELVLQRYTKLRSKVKKASTVVKAKLPEFKDRVHHKLRESVIRGAHSAGHVVARAAVEIKSPMNRILTLFVGDVFTYLAERGNCRMPGWIPSCFLAALMDAREEQLRRDGEPIIVMSHSMGGQIVYDAVTHFLPLMPEYQDVRIDFWAASASQVGLFEELKLFIESSDEYHFDADMKVPFPDRQHLGYWWNVWDHNDFVSYSVKDIIEGVDDEPYNTGLNIVSAHGGYLELPSFFRRFAKKIEFARRNNWQNPPIA